MGRKPAPRRMRHLAQAGAGLLAVVFHKPRGRPFPCFSQGTAAALPPTRHAAGPGPAVRPTWAAPENFNGSSCCGSARRRTVCLPRKAGPRPVRLEISVPATRTTHPDASERKEQPRPAPAPCGRPNSHPRAASDAAPRRWADKWTNAPLHDSRTMRGPRPSSRPRALLRRARPRVRRAMGHRIPPAKPFVRPRFPGPDVQRCAGALVQIPHFAQPLHPQQIFN